MTRHTGHYMLHVFIAECEQYLLTPETDYGMYKFIFNLNTSNISCDLRLDSKVIIKHCSSVGSSKSPFV